MSFQDEEGLEITCSLIFNIQIFCIDLDKLAERQILLPEVLLAIPVCFSFSSVSQQKHLVPSSLI